MRERLVKLFATLAVLGAVAVGATAVATAGGGSPAKTKAKPAAATHTARLQSTGTAKTMRGLQATPARPRTTTGDGDQIEQGDQSTPDTQAELAGENENGAAESESNAEPEQGQPGEPAVGHEDPPGQDADHECTGDCVE